MLAVSSETMSYYYPDWDTLGVELYDWIHELVPAEAHVLDLGAGGGVSDMRNLKPHFANVCAVDIDPIVLDNQCAHEAKQLNEDCTIPYPDESFDAAMSDYVFEHLEVPEDSLREMARVLKPGGKFFYRTVNRWHYLCILGRCMPKKCSAYLADRLGHQPTEAAKTHETWYRLNSKTQISRAAAAAGMRIGAYKTHEAEPVYFQLFAPAWYIGVLMERCANACPLFAPWRVNLYGYLEKMP